MDGNTTPVGPENVTLEVTMKVTVIVLAMVGLYLVQDLAL
jgi:hypothetical protein